MKFEAKTRSQGASFLMKILVQNIFDFNDLFRTFVIFLTLETSTIS